MSAAVKGNGIETSRSATDSMPPEIRRRIREVPRGRRGPRHSARFPRRQWPESPIFGRAAERHHVIDVAIRLQPEDLAERCVT
jgi:hypothetical protein